MEANILKGICGILDIGSVVGKLALGLILAAWARRARSTARMSPKASLPTTDPISCPTDTL